MSDIVEAQITKKGDWYHLRVRRANNKTSEPNSAALTREALQRVAAEAGWPIVKKWSV